ncbi:MAG: type III PLP-dependent enzyme [Alphaproteobacteria bacterium]|nr:type III PLP-dependent enzyme [Alphaproteobacteria bacterium]
MNSKLAEFVNSRRGETPFLVVDLDQIGSNYLRLKRLMPAAEVFYAVKANPAAPVLDRLQALGSSFDAASLTEVEMCLTAGAPAKRISFGNTIKKQAHIARAHELGVDLYAFDSLGELKKLAQAAPGARVYCRIALDNIGADWPLSRKFGCSLRMAADLMQEAGERGLTPLGISFHVGSQQCDPQQWDVAIAKTAMVFSDLRARGIELLMINMGGGFPVRYRKPIPAIEAIAAGIHGALTRHFGNDLPDTIIEPGRAIVGDAGVLAAEVVLISEKDYGAAERWVYLDVGKFGGLAETQGEAIQYTFRTPRDGGANGRVVIAGPTCDGADILYETSGYEMPKALETGDQVQIMAAGAYTTTYASIGFNGFAPLKEYYI